MDFHQLLNPSSDRQRAASGDASSSRMAVDALLSGPGAAAPVPAFADNLYTPATEPGGFAPSEFELSPAAPPPPPPVPAFDPLAILDPALLAAQVRDAMGDAHPAARGASPVSATDLVADSDDESRPTTAGEPSTSRPEPVKMEQDSEVDLVGAADEAATVAALKAQSRLSATPKPRAKPSSSKGKARPAHLSSTVTSPAPSPGPSGLSHELLYDGAGSSLGSLTESSAYPTAPPMSPSSYVHPRLDPSHPRPHLPPQFETYRPPRRATIGADDDETDSDDDEDARRKERSRRAAEAARKGKNRANRAKEDDEEVDGRLYCICKELYDPERMMIACDSCEEWFHIDCVNIDDEAVSLVDLFFCPRCSAVSHTNRTTWKRACARPTCRSPAAPLSKYCTDYCGIAVAAARLSLLETERGVDPSTFWDRVAGAQRREAEVTEAPRTAEDADLPALEDLPAPERAAREADLRAKAWARQDAADAALRADLVSQLRANEARRAGLRDKLRLVQQRKAYLGIAVRRWEALCVATAAELKREGIDVGVDEEEAVNERKSGSRRKGRGGGAGKKKGPQAPTSLPTAQCGLDVRLVLDEAAWRAWVEGEGRDMLEAEERGDAQGAVSRALDNLEGVCLETRKRCDRHQGWQKLRDQDFRLEESVLDRRVRHFDTLGTALSSRLAQHDQAVAFHLAHRARTCDPSVLVPVEDFFSEQDESRERASERQQSRRRERSPSLRAGVDAAEANKVADGVEVPDEVLQYLSRAQLRKLKRQGRV